MVLSLERARWNRPMSEGSPPTARKSRNVGFSQNGSDFIGAVDYGGDNDDARDRSRNRNFKGGVKY
jgi:hypothetical protein